MNKRPKEAAACKSAPSTPAVDGTKVLESPAQVAKRKSKQQLLADLLLRDSGATLDQMVSAMGWLPHTTRAALTGLKKKGYALSSDKIDGVRTYRAEAPE